MKPAYRVLRTAALGLASLALAPQAFSADLTLPRDGWSSWQVAAVGEAPDWCCWSDNSNFRDAPQTPCRLDRNHNGYGSRNDATTDVVRIYARTAGGRIDRLRVFSAGCSICTLGPVGAAHVFHTHNIAGPVPPPDDRDTPYIAWPNFHSGANGDVQRVEAELPLHPVMRDDESETGAVMYLPAHPHEGAVVAPQSDPDARVIATGRSLASGQRFNIAVAFERSGDTGPAIAESTFHHFADYNWDARRGSPDFVTEAPAYTLPGAQRAMASVHRYVRNLAVWLAPAHLTP